MAKKNLLGLTQSDWDTWSGNTARALWALDAETGTEPNQSNAFRLDTTGIQEQMKEWGATEGADTIFMDSFEPELIGPGNFWKNEEALGKLVMGASPWTSFAAVTTPEKAFGLFDIPHAEFFKASKGSDGGWKGMIQGVGFIPDDAGGKFTKTIAHGIGASGFNVNLAISIPIAGLIAKWADDAISGIGDKWLNLDPDQDSNRHHDKADFSAWETQLNWDTAGPWKRQEMLDNGMGPLEKTITKEWRGTLGKLFNSKSTKVTTAPVKNPGFVATDSFHVSGTGSDAGLYVKTTANENGYFIPQQQLTEAFKSAQAKYPKGQQDKATWHSDTTHASGETGLGNGIVDWTEVMNQAQSLPQGGFDASKETMQNNPLRAHRPNYFGDAIDSAPLTDAQKADLGIKRTFNDMAKYGVSDFASPAETLRMQSGQMVATALEGLGVESYTPTWNTEGLHGNLGKAKAPSTGQKGANPEADYGRTVWKMEPSNALKTRHGETLYIERNNFTGEYTFYENKIDFTGDVIEKTGNFDVDSFPGTASDLQELGNINALEIEQRLNQFISTSDLAQTGEFTSSTQKISFDQFMERQAQLINDQLAQAYTDLASLQSVGGVPLDLANLDAAQRMEYITGELAKVNDIALDKYFQQELGISLEDWKNITDMMEHADTLADNIDFVLDAAEAAEIAGDITSPGTMFDSVLTGVNVSDLVNKLVVAGAGLSVLFSPDKERITKKVNEIVDGPSPEPTPEGTPEGPPVAEATGPKSLPPGVLPEPGFTPWDLTPKSEETTGKEPLPEVEATDLPDGENIWEDNSDDAIYKYHKETLRDGKVVGYEWGNDPDSLIVRWWDGDYDDIKPAPPPEKPDVSPSRDRPEDDARNQAIKDRTLDRDEVANRTIIDPVTNKDITDDIDQTDPLGGGEWPKIPKHTPPPTSTNEKNKHIRDNLKSEGFTDEAIDAFIAANYINPMWSNRPLDVPWGIDDGTEIETGTETGGDPLPGGETGGDPLPGGETGGDPLPGGETGDDPLPGGETGGDPLPGGETGGDPLPGGETGDDPLPGGETGGDPLPGGEAGGDPLPGGETGDDPGGETDVEPGPPPGGELDIEIVPPKVPPPDSGSGLHTPLSSGDELEGIGYRKEKTRSTQYSHARRGRAYSSKYPKF